MNKITVLIGVVIMLVVTAAVLILLPPGEANAPTTDHQNLIVVQSIGPGDTVNSPLVITGEARGYWYFEASFPIEIRDQNDAIISQGYAQAEGEWMTEEFVPFTSIPLTFTPQPPGSTGTIVLKKDNPSGLPEHDDELVIPIVF